MMPHPERAVETILGSTDGLRLFESLLENGRIKVEAQLMKQAMTPEEIKEKKPYLD